MSGQRDDLHVTAVHEAGHAVYAFAVGIALEMVSVRPEGNSRGRVIRRWLPRPGESDCRPDSLWFEIQVRFYLSGDRAVRVHYPLLQTVGGGPTADYAKAVRLLETVCDGSKVEAELDRHCRALDDFFAVPAIREQLDAITERLVDEIEIDGAALQHSLFGDKCGAIDPTTTHRCESRPHRLGDHAYVHHRPEKRDFFWSMWPGFGAVHPTPKSKMSPLLRRVLRIVEPELFPPPRRDPKLDDLPKRESAVSNPALTKRARASEMRKIVKLLEQRARADQQLLPPPDGRDDEALSALDRHDRQCRHDARQDVDGYWCAHCAFEFNSATTRTRSSWIYQIVELRLMRPMASETAEVVASPSAIFPTADHAANYVRLAREAHPAAWLEVRRWPWLGSRR